MRHTETSSNFASGISSPKMSGILLATVNKSKKVLNPGTAAPSGKDREPDSKEEGLPEISAEGRKVIEPETMNSRIR